MSASTYSPGSIDSKTKVGDTGRYKSRNSRNKSHQRPRPDAHEGVELRDRSVTSDDDVKISFSRRDSLLEPLNGSGEAAQKKIQKSSASCCPESVTFSSASRVMYYVGNVANTTLHTGYALTHFFTKLAHLNPSFLRISPYALLLSLLPVGYLGWAEATAHNVQSIKIHAEPAKDASSDASSDVVVIERIKKSFLSRFCQLTKFQKACLIGHFGSYFFQDMQTGFFYGQKADIEDQFDVPEIAAFYFGIVLYAIGANFQEIPNTLVSFEQVNNPAVEYFSYGEKSPSETGESRCSWHRVGFSIGNFLNTLIYASYAIAHFLTAVCRLKVDFYGVSRWGAAMSFLPILYFSYSEARAHDAQAKELECANNQLNQSASLSIRKRFQSLSWEQRTAVFGHFLSDIFQDLQPLIFIGQLAGMDELNPLELVVTYALMVLYGFLANLMEAFNTLASFEGENAFVLLKSQASSSKASASPATDPEVDAEEKSISP